MPVDVLAPPLGTNVDSVVLKSWYKQEGETVTAGEPLFSVETDKATLDVEAPASGILRQVAYQAGMEVKTLSRMAVIASPDEVLAGPQTASTKAPNPQPTPSIEKRQAANAPEIHRKFISPRARVFADEEKVDWHTIPGSGPEGAIVLRDVKGWLESRRTPKITPLAERISEQTGLDWTRLEGSGVRGRITRQDIDRAAAHASTENELLESIAMTGVRGLIAERMSHSSAQSAHVTLDSEADATALVELREKLAAEEIQVSYNDIFLCALARALVEHPRLNASLQDNAIKIWKGIHIGLAVDTDRGLIVPVVRDVNRKKLTEVTRETKKLIEAALQGNSLPEDLRGGTFTLTNLGMYGIDSFTPIINLPECAILGVGRIAARPVVVNGQVMVRQMVWLSLTFDHRLIDGGPAARFLQRVVELIGHPYLLLA